MSLSDSVIKAEHCTKLVQCIGKIIRNYIK